MLKSKLTTNLKKNYMADRCMKEYTMGSGPEVKLFLHLRVFLLDNYNYTIFIYVLE